MKILKKVLLILVSLVLLIVGTIYAYLLTTKPQYDGNLKLDGIKQQVEVLFDEYAIPHIYAQNQEDAYFALGYVHAQERLFQMELLRRVGSGRLAEIFGEKLVKTDKLFRATGIHRVSQQTKDKYFSSDTLEYQKIMNAYLAGLNSYIKNGKTPVEFQILGIPKQEFTVSDVLDISGYVSFSFALAYRTDPVLEKIAREYGADYLSALAIDYTAGTERIPVFPKNVKSALGSEIVALLDALPTPLWEGSNSWVVAPSRSKSGQVVFANDTHIAFAQPAVWYEAHLEYPNYSFYGNFFAGVPYALIGHTREHAWGLTMFENDDIDFYVERQNPENENQVWAIDHWEDLKIITETIKVKGAENEEFTLKMSRHGPIVNQFLGTLKDDKSPIAAWWTYERMPSKLVLAFYGLNYAKNIGDARQAASMISAPGLNVMYGDKAGNIAWWAAAKLIKRPKHVHSKLFLDGASGKDDPLGYYDFSENPQAENPPNGYVFSSNNQPDSIAGILYPGYYSPEGRAKRVHQYLKSEKQWTVEKMKGMVTDVRSPNLPDLAKELAEVIVNQEDIDLSDTEKQALSTLKNWDGEHQLANIEPTIFTKFLTIMLQKTLADELGNEAFKSFMSTHLYKRTFPILLKNDSTKWWDNVDTETVETRSEIFAQSFRQAVSELTKQFGDNINDWEWGKAHTIEHVHAIGRQKPFDKLFNVGAFPVTGGNALINNLAFHLAEDGNYKVTGGPAMRILLDFADVENSLSVLPTGESGNFMSKHYNDQAEMFNTGKFRKQLMNRQEIEKSAIGRLIFE